MDGPTARVFVDTSAWIALAHQRDQAHRRAALRWSEIRQRGLSTITTSLVAAECHVLLTRRIGAKPARDFVRAILNYPGRNVIRPDHELTISALESLARFDPDPVSLTDAVSFEVMRREDVAVAFAFDEHFRQAGFEIWQ